MSETKITIENDTKDAEKSNISEQTGPDTTVHLHADEAEEKDVRGSVLHTKEEHDTRRNELETHSKTDIPINKTGVLGKDKEYTVCFDVGRQNDQRDLPPPYGGHQYQQPRRALYSSGGALNYSDGDFYDRNAFVRKVTLITFIMLSMTAGFLAAVFIVEDIGLFFHRFHFVILMVSGIGMIVMSVTMPTASCARRSPTNYLCLLIALILESLFCAAITCRYRTAIVVQALIVTVVVVAVCVILACTNFDFTKCLLLVIAIGTALLALAVVILVSMLVFHIYSKPLILVLLVLLTLFSIWTLIIDLQMILGGKSIELSENDYALGAFMLYTSIIDIFIQIAMGMRIADD